MKHKRQHVIPNCYLKSWCDPKTPAGQTPYIWRVSKDGKTKTKRSPEKSFTATDRYTVKMPDGDRNLVIEDTLSGIEREFSNVLGRIRCRERLTPRDRARLCLFAAAMQTRTIAMAEHWRSFYQKVHNQVVAMEKQRGASPRTSLETADMVEHAHHDIIQSGIEVLAPMLFRMPMTILVSDDDLGFITSDNPAVLFNPKGYKLPPMLRHPGLAQPDVEFSLPLTPHHLLLVSHTLYSSYADVGQQTVDEANRLRLDFCTEEIVVWKGETRDSWFDPGTMPDDAWENTPEGKKAIAENEARRKWQEEYDRSRAQRKAPVNSAEPAKPTVP